MQVLLMVALRGHYFIDLISGVIFAHYIWMMAERYSFLIDVKIFRMPFKKRFPLYTNSCAKCQHPINLWVDKNETMDCIVPPGPLHSSPGEGKEVPYQYVERSSV